MGADAVIAVSVDPAKLPDLEDPSMINIMRRCDLIRGIHMSQPGRKGRRLPVPRHERQRLGEFLSSGEFIKAGEGKRPGKAAPGAGSAAQEKALVPAHL